MTGSTITGSVTHEVVLGVKGYTDPLTISASGIVQPASGIFLEGVLVNSGYVSAVVVNHGDILGPEPTDYPNTSDGGGGIGVVLLTPATLTNTGVVKGCSGGTYTYSAGGYVYPSAPPDYDAAYKYPQYFYYNSDLRHAPSGHNIGGTHRAAAHLTASGSGDGDITGTFNGGTGVYGAAGVTINNTGLIEGGAGGGAGAGPNGGRGVVLDGAGSTLTNTDDGNFFFGIVGGSGGAGGNGRGGTGVDLRGRASAVNASVIIGGSGGSLAGAGGAGAVIYDSYLTNLTNGKMTGGAGGGGDVDDDAFTPGTGGAGAYLRSVTDAASDIINDGTITGGAGGSIDQGLIIGNGGQGGVGVKLAGSGAFFSNNGRITGGKGGAASQNKYGGDAGIGGYGVVAEDGVLAANGGVISGGAGGAGGLNGGAAGGGGVGLVAARFFNTGIITGGARASASATGSNGVHDLAGYFYNRGGRIYGGAGGYGLVAEGAAGSFSGTASVTNSGYIIGGQGRAGIAVDQYAVVRNLGSVLGGADAGGDVYVHGGTLINSGSIFSGGAAGKSVINGAVLSSGGTVINSGLIDSTSEGIASNADGTVTNTGTIIGGAGAINFAQDSHSRLIIDAASSIVGTVNGGGGVLELAADKAAPGTFNAAMETQFSEFSTIQVDSGALWDISGTLAAATILVNDGTIKEPSGERLTIDSPISGTGSIDISKKSLTLKGSVASGQQISFTGTGEVLDLGSPKKFSGEIENFAVGDTIDLTSIDPGDITATHFAGGVLKLTEASGKIDITFASPASFGADHPAVFSDAGGVGITLTAGAAAVPAQSIAAAWPPLTSVASAASFPSLITLSA